MHHIDEKGIKVNRTEHRAQRKLFATTGLRVTLHALLGARVSGELVSPRARRYKLGAALSVAVGAAYIASVLLFFAAPALAGGLKPALAGGFPQAEPAGGPPQARIQLIQSEPYSTRLHVQPEVNAEGSPTTWVLEISTSPSGPWSTLQSGTLKAHENGGIYILYHHLSPGTRYYLQLIATNASGTTTRTQISYSAGAMNELDYPENFSSTWFKTAPVSRPEFNEDDDVSFSPCGATETSARCSVEEIETNGAQTTYHFEYALPEGGHAPAEGSPLWKPVTSGAEGTITVAEDFSQNPSAGLTGLTPETVYYARVKAENEKGESSRIGRFETRTAKPVVYPVRVSNVTSTSAHLSGEFQAGGYETEYHLEYTTEPGNSGSWVQAPGGSGTIVAADATEKEYRRVTTNLTGLTPATTYFVRLFAKNSHGEATSNLVQSFATSGPLVATTFAVHALHGAAVRLLGVSPSGSSTDEEQSVTVGGGATGGTFTLSFDGETTAPIPYITHETEPNEESEEGRVSRALRALPSIGEGNVSVSENFATSSYTVEFVGALAGRSLSQLTADASGLTPSGAVAVATVQEGSAYHVHYHFEYVSQQQFEESERAGENGFAKAVSTPEVEGSGVVGEDISGLQPGATYHFRIAAASNAPGGSVVYGATQTLTAPTPAAADAQAPCPNEALRVGPSAKLPDCRAYEQVTPTGKRGAMDFDRYGANQDDGALPGYDGDHVSVHAVGVDWGTSPDAKEANYVFNRTETGWRMASLAPQPEAGLNTYKPAIFSPDLTQVAVEVGWTTGPSDSPDVDLMAGPPGGPYATVASIPRSSISHSKGGAFVAASADSSKYVFQTEDHKLLGQSTGTLSGEDLYEFSAEGGLRQVNVQGGSPGTRISTCGAQIVAGLQAVSADGSRVFFTDNCTHDLYMRVGGAETVDIGEYEFLAGNAEDSEVLLGKGSGEGQEVFLYDTEARTAKLLPGAAPGKVSEDLSTIYFSSSKRLTPGAPQGSGGLYRYEVATETTHFVLPIESDSSTESYSFSLSPDGRYLYISGTSGTIPGVPGGAPQTKQIYRLDTVEDVIECVSCASSFDPEPKLSAFLAGAEVTGGNTDNGALERMSGSADGDYIFFDTPAALVPADVDGEIAPNEGAGDNYEYLSGGGVYSPSSDVYEWRGNGVGGCGAVQGCLSLITTGQGNGLRNVLYGTDASGRDVFFGTHESLVASDDDTAGDIYDARVDGGFPLPPPGAVECEGDACSTPANPPNDVTPSSLTFTGAGNLAQPPATKSGNGSRESGKHKPRKQGSKRKRAAKKGTKRRSHAKSAKKRSHTKSSRRTK